MEPGKSLYDALGVPKDAPASAIRKAYLQLAVQLHPDKNPGDEKAKERFQTLQKVYGILSDEEKRKVYDRTGSVEESEQLDGDQFDGLYSFYRNMYAPLTKEALDAFASTFRGSAEERAEVLKYYQRFEGSMRSVFDWVMCSNPELDSHRFMHLVDEAIAAGEVKRYKKYTTWANRTASRPPPSVDPLAPPPKREKKSARRGGEASEAALAAHIRSKQASAFERVQQEIIGKYGGEAPAGNEEPSEEDFQAARQRVLQRLAGGEGSAAGSRGPGKPKRASSRAPAGDGKKKAKT